MMPSTIPLPPHSSAERNQLIAVEVIRRRALSRLYERREAVNELIQALEEYQNTRNTRLGQCVTLNVGRKCQ